MTPRGLGASANDRIKEHLGLLPEMTESEVSMVPNASSTQLDLSAPSDDLYSPLSHGSALSSSKEFVLSPLPVLPADISPASPSSPTASGSPRPPAFTPSPPLPAPLPAPLSVPAPTAAFARALQPSSSSSAAQPGEEARSAQAEGGEAEGGEAERAAHPASLRSFGSLSEFLSALGMAEYLGVLTSHGVEKVTDMFQLSEEDLKTLGLKFGHRKKLIEIMTNTDALYRFLSGAQLLGHYKELWELGFDSMWSLMGISEDYREKMGLSEEEMQRVIKARDALIEEKKAEIDALPEFKDLKGSSSSKPVLSLMVSDARADMLIDVGALGGGNAQDGALSNISYLKLFDMSGIDECKLKLGEAMGLCYLVSVGFDGCVKGSG